MSITPISTTAVVASRPGVGSIAGTQSGVTVAGAVWYGPAVASVETTPWNDRTACTSGLTTEMSKHDGSKRLDPGSFAGGLT